MLVLSRKQEEKIFIGEDITVTVIRMDNGRVKLGIDAPPEVFIRRGELVDQWQDSKELSLAGAGSGDRGSGGGRCRPRHG